MVHMAFAPARHRAGESHMAFPAPALAAEPIYRGSRAPFPFQPGRLTGCASGAKIDFPPANTHVGQAIVACDGI